MANPSDIQAFPTSYGTQGMTLRDWFAGQAISASLQMNHNRGLAEIRPGSPMHPDLAAKHAYRIADAMLHARAIAHHGEEG